MDDAAVATAIAARFANLTPPTGEDPITNPTDQLPSQVSSSPALLVFPADEELEWLPNKVRKGEHFFTVEFMRAQNGDFSTRMAAMTAWRPVLRDRVAGQMQLGLAYVDFAELRAISLVEVTYAAIKYDALELAVYVRTREVVPTAAA